MGVTVQGQERIRKEREREKQGVGRDISVLNGLFLALDRR